MKLLYQIHIIAFYIRVQHYMASVKIYNYDFVCSNAYRVGSLFVCLFIWFFFNCSFFLSFFVSLFLSFFLSFFACLFVVSVFFPLKKRYGIDDVYLVIFVLIFKFQHVSFEQDWSSQVTML